MSREKSISGSLAHLAHEIIKLNSIRAAGSIRGCHTGKTFESKNQRRRRNGQCLSYVGVEFQRNLSTLIFYAASAQVGVTG